MDACRDNGSKENVYKQKFMNVHSAFLIWKYKVRVWPIEWYLKNAGILRDQKNPVFEKICRDR